MADDRKRVFWFEVYPDSAPSDWRDYLDWDVMVPFAVSPLHDHDVYTNPRKLPEGKHVGDPKKPHYHVLLKFEGKKSVQQVKDLVSYCAANDYVEEVKDIRAAVRYFTHIDHPEKYQYSREDVRAYCGFDLGDAYMPKGSEIDRILNEIENLIYANDLHEFAALAEVVRASENPDWLYVFRRTSTSYFKALMQSRHFKKREDLMQNTSVIQGVAITNEQLNGFSPKCPDEFINYDPNTGVVQE